MSIFRRKQKFNPESADVSEMEPKGLQQAITEAVNPGSTDIKVIAVTLEDNSEVNFFVSKGTIKHVSNGQEVKVLSKLNSLVPEISGETQETIQIILDSTPFFHAIRRINDELSPELSEAVADAFRQNTVRLIEECSSKMVKKVSTDWVSGERPADIKAYDNFALSFADVENFVLQRESMMEKSSGFLKGSALSDVTVSATDTVYTTSFSCSEERFVLTNISHNDNSINLQELFDKSDGFDWIKVLKTIEGLQWKGKVELSFIGAANQEEPTGEDSFDFSEEDFNDFMNGLPVKTNIAEVTAFIPQKAFPANPVFKIEESINNNTFSEIVPTGLDNNDSDSNTADSTNIGFTEDEEDDGWRFSAPSNDPDDDGSFVYEEEPEKNEHLTHGFELNLQEGVSKVLNESEVDESTRKKILDLVEFNEDLESSISLSEPEILSVGANYRGHFGNYQVIVAQSIVEQMTEAEETSDREQIESTRLDSNSAFFELAELEFNRFVMNESRVKTLKEIASIISELPGAHVQEALHIIEEKIYGAENVVNIAFHDKKDDAQELQNIDMTLLDNSLLEKYSEKDSPTFFSVVKGLGFNPFEDIVRNH